MGIDHIVIRNNNSEKSQHFYINFLGFQQEVGSWNKGTEQELLYSVEGAFLNITCYRSAKGHGVEFLQYLRPGKGKPFPAESRADDIWLWQTTLIVDDAECLFAKLKSANSVFISKEIVHQQLSNVQAKSFIGREPDGHATMIRGNVSPNSLRGVKNLNAENLCILITKTFV